MTQCEHANGDYQEDLEIILYILASFFFLLLEILVKTDSGLARGGED